MLTSFHFWLFTGVLQEIPCEVTRKIGFAGLNRDPEVCKLNRSRRAGKAVTAKLVALSLAARRALLQFKGSAAYNLTVDQDINPVCANPKCA